MGNKMKSFVAAVALASRGIFLGPSIADAEDFGRHVSFHGQNFHSFSHRSLAPFLVRHRAFVRPFYPYSRAFLAYPRPYRLVRVFVYNPFPRWVYRRVYRSASYSGSYCPY